MKMTIGTVKSALCVEFINKFNIYANESLLITFFFICSRNMYKQSTGINLSSPNATMYV